LIKEIFMQHVQNSRRDFLKVSALATGGLLVGLAVPGMGNKATAAGLVHTPNAWVHIADDNTITLLSARSEMGQGVYTSMPMLIAEELNISIDQIKVALAPPGKAYINTLIGAQLTGGSTSVRDGWESLRIAGAQVREMLVAAAAASWKVDAAAVKAENGMLNGPGGKQASYGQMAAAAAKLPVPAAPKLKPASEFKVVGQRVTRLDTPSKVNGTARFGVDVTLPGMVYATMIQCPVIGGKAKSFDAAQAQKMPGVSHVIQVGGDVAVVANSWWRAKKAAEKVVVQWDEGAGAGFSSAGALESTRAAAKSGKVIAIQPPKGDVASALKASAKVLSAEYISPLQAHAPLEPMNFVADVRADGAHMIGGTQFQQGVQGAVAGALGLKPEQVTCDTTFLGGGFGRRIELDFVVQAALVSKAVGKPVKLLWTREEDMTHDYYRPLGVMQIQAGLDAHGVPQAMHFKVTSQSVTQRAFGLPKDVLDPFMAEAAVAPYNVANTKHDLVIHDTGSRVGYWRAVSHNMNAFANESFMDELASAAGQDPLQYRLSLLDGHERYANVLRMAATKAGWGKPLPAGRELGLAVMEGYGSYMAQVAEVSLNADGSVRVHRVTVAADPGMMVNPDTVEAQIQSGIIFGMGSALKHEIHVVKGQVQEKNFNTFEPVRMHEAPVIDIHLVKSTEKPGGMGEPATAVIGPAIANAVARLTGKRVRQMPITPQAIAQA
jgi:isoquinoline 1-oxidoreductase subunit beta